MLRRAVLPVTGAVSGELELGPVAGVDFAAVKLDGRYLIVSSDPVTGVSEDIGWYAINVSANDVATSGAMPRFVETVVMLPEGSGEDEVGKVMNQVDKAARELGVSVLGGHTEITEGLKRPIVVATVFGLTDRYVSSMGARQGDLLMMTKTAGLEGTAVIASRAEELGLRLEKRVRERALRLRKKLSIVGEAVEAFKTGAVHAMHDCTEGGVIGAVFEMSLASGLGFELDEGTVPVDQVTRTICKSLGIDPLGLIGSGSLLLAVEQGKEGLVKERLKERANVAVVGRFREKGRVVIKKDGERKEIKEPPTDELWRVLGG